MRAIVVDEYGGPEVLRMRELPPPVPKAGEILVDILAVGVNFMDMASRKAGPSSRPLPLVPGVEAAGVITDLGPNVAEFEVGDRVAWPYAFGTYAEQIAVPGEIAVGIPGSVSYDIAAAIMMQGLTAHHFVSEVAPIQSGDVVLVHAAAGGLGQLLTQFIKLHGGTVIGLVSRRDKVAIAQSSGADHVLVSTGDKFVDEVLWITNNEGVRTVFDGGGQTTFRASLKVTRRHGTVVYYGAMIGEVPVISMRELPNSIKVCFPVFLHHIPTRERLLKHSAEIFSLVENGELDVNITTRYPLANASQAHRDMESRATTGKLLLIPERSS